MAIDGNVSEMFRVQAVDGSNAFSRRHFRFSCPVPHGPDPEVRARWQGTSLEPAPKSPGCSEIMGTWVAKPQATWHHGDFGRDSNVLDADLC